MCPSTPPLPPRICHICPAALELSRQQTGCSKNTHTLCTVLSYCCNTPVQILEQYSATTTTLYHVQRLWFEQPCTCLSCEAGLGRSYTNGHLHCTVLQVKMRLHRNKLNTVHDHPHRAHSHSTNQTYNPAKVHPPMNQLSAAVQYRRRSL